MVKDTAIRDGVLVDLAEEEMEGEDSQTGHPKQAPPFAGRSDIPQSPKMRTLLLRRTSADLNGNMVRTTIPVKANLEDMRDHLKNLGPSNPASNPKATRVSAVKIKPGAAPQPRSGSIDVMPPELHDGDDDDENENESTSLLRPQLTVKDGVQALHQSYQDSLRTGRGDSRNPAVGTTDHDKHLPSKENDRPRTGRTTSSEENTSPTEGGEVGPIVRRRGHVRSGSITENIVEAGGIRKVVLEANSSSESEGDADLSRSTGSISDGDKSSTSNKKKNRRRTCGPL